MPLDGVVVNCLIHEFHDRILNGRIEKIYQPENDELIVLIRNNGKNERLLLSANANHPRAHLIDSNKPNPAKPPMFCMLLRKHLTGGRIIDIVQPEFERIIYFHIEAYNELGDLTTKNLIVEIMGRHSNIILTDSNGKILDSIKHIGFDVSSVRQVMPGLSYGFPPSQEKFNPLDCSLEEIRDILSKQNQGIKSDKAIMNSFMGISPLLAREIIFRSLKSIDFYIGELDEIQLQSVANEVYTVFENIKKHDFKPIIILDQINNKVIDFYALDILQYTQYNILDQDSISTTLGLFYSARDGQQRLKQKSSELVKLINTNLDRCKKKLNIQQEKLGEVSNREQLKVFGDLITANIYNIKQGVDYIETENFYEEGYPIIKIPLDTNLTPAKNAQKYFNEYTKSKNASIEVAKQIQLNIAEIEYLESISDLLLRLDNEQDINEIREELIQEGYIKKIKSKKQKNNENKSSKPMHFISTDGVDIYVGKNNKQNDFLTLKFAQKDDIWLHTKDIPGSHTIIKMAGKDSVPDNTIIEAAILAAFHSKARMSSNVAIDYTKVRNVKKPSGAKPGMVIYENNKTIYVTPDEEIVDKLHLDEK